MQPEAAVVFCPTHTEQPMSGTCARCGRFVCGRCPMGADGVTCDSCFARQDLAPRALGGWLWLAFIGLIGTAVQCIVQTFLNFVEALKAGIHVALEDEAWVRSVAASSAINAVFVAFIGVVMVHFLMRKRRTINLMTAFYVCSFIFNLYDVFTLEAADRVKSGTWVRFFVSILWVRYFRSRRVAESFTRG